ncbi:cellular tumor antigen p53-like isoform X2 [Eriocheir sinensis]|uniref:cellular tumor antigen p53-like isoform X2 n=1 Tax=Eriocheir sinensis TaxID=95602 RepID=UPI0021C5FB8C|nr:cellular tumor antigen p53-like isoform X2 [Eriocheir sinensis]
MNYFPYNQDSAMNENQQDSEPLLDDADYQLLRSDSFLNRLGSNNFASLIEAPAAPIPENDVAQQQPQPLHHHQPPHHPPQQQQQLEMQLLHDADIIDPLFIDSSLLAVPQSNLHLDPNESWSQVETIQSETDSLSSLLNHEAPVAIVDGSSSISYLPDSTPTQVVPSLQAWPGQYDFQISLPIENKDRNKWCFSTEQNKLYLCPHVAVPINIQLLQFIDASITITPVFRDSRHRVQPVVPCFNCKSKINNDTKDHLVMVEGQECDYKMVNDRFVVSVPLHPPPPGEAASTLLLLLNCLTSCVGGPNRRPFCLVFTLHDNTGAVIGRQILDLKCCKCPSRDLLNEDRAAIRNREHALHSHPPGDRSQALKRSAPVTTTGDKKRRFNIKLEPGTEQRYRTLPVPIEYVPQVKRYINCLISEAYMRRNMPKMLLFSEDEI